MQICLFEDINCENLEPLSLSRPVYGLVCGIYTLGEKILRSFPGLKYSFHCRKYLSDLLRQEFPGVPVNEIKDDTCLFINGRILTDEKLSALFNSGGKEDRVFLSGGNVAAARLSGENLERFRSDIPDAIGSESFGGLPVENVEINLVNYIWDLINRNGEEISRDFKFLKTRNKPVKKGSGRKIYEGVHIVNRKNVFIGQGVEIKPGCVIDASKGPVYIDKNVQVFPNAVIEGPAYIGEGTKIKSGAAIYENVSIGKVCKVGGEVEDIIMLPYSNKQHAGFIGHAYIGSWVNLGADTNNSDLKNNYSTVKVTVNGKEVDSGLQFLGLVIGDHSKTAINTMLNTGTNAGFSCNIFGAGFPSKHIPSFSWGGAESLSVYDVEKSIQTAEIVYKRRDKEFTGTDAGLFRTIFNMTNKDRKEKGVK